MLYDSALASSDYAHGKCASGPSATACALSAGQPSQPADPCSVRFRQLCRRSSYRNLQTASCGLSISRTPATAPGVCLSSSKRASSKSFVTARFLLPRSWISRPRRVGREKGLLSVAFHPKYKENGRFFVNYTGRRDGVLKTIIAEYRVSQTNPDVADRTERVILEIEQPFANHNGGLNKFGPDGLLYIGMGDGGAAGDPFNFAQNLESLLGKFLRIDIEKEPYAIPQDNPFVGRANAQGEIWAYGLRNPWRFSFDRCTGRLFAGDVGQDRIEEIDLIEKGKNYGWRIMEGSQCFDPPSLCNTQGLELPIAEYDHSLGCSVTGGYVYRGTQFPTLIGHYLFGDYCSGRIWSLTEDPQGRWTMRQLIDSPFSISSFGEDEQGELYVIHYGGAIYRVTAK
jgi:glucose/arabinose dehydrogenase